jgi:hypothetical protein
VRYRLLPEYVRQIPKKPALRVEIRPLSDV